MSTPAGTHKNTPQRIHQLVQTPDNTKPTPVLVHISCIPVRVKRGEALQQVGQRGNLALVALAARQQRRKVALHRRVAHQAAHLQAAQVGNEPVRFYRQEHTASAGAGKLSEYRLSNST